MHYCHPGATVREFLPPRYIDLGSNRQISTQHARFLWMVPTDTVFLALFFQGTARTWCQQWHASDWHPNHEIRRHAKQDGLSRVHMRIFFLQFAATNYINRNMPVAALAVLLASCATIATTSCPITRAAITLPRSHFKQLYLFNCSTNSNRLQGSHAPSSYYSPHDHNTTGKQGKEETEGMQGNLTELTSLSLL